MEPNAERVITPMPKSLVQAIDDYRFSARAPSRSAAIRQLLEAGELRPLYEDQRYDALIVTAVCSQIPLTLGGQ